jgi:Domain of unknown function (DUF397)
MPASAWRKSSFSEAGNCVEVRGRDGLILVRDTKLSVKSSPLFFSLSAWHEFVDGVNVRRLSSRVTRCPAQASAVKCGPST